MRFSRTLLLLAVCMLALAVTVTTGTAATTAAKKTAAAPMHQYLLMVPHTADQCLATLDQMSAKGGAELAKWEFGCEAGDHTAYRIVKAASPDDAKAMVPEAERDLAQVKPLNSFTVAEIKSYHAQMDKAAPAEGGK